jgi:hypothetical protein
MQQKQIFKKICEKLNNYQKVFGLREILCLYAKKRL